MKRKIMDHHDQQTPRSSSLSHFWLTVLGCVAVMAVVLVIVSFAPSGSYLIYLMLLCPILHLLLHRRHGGHRH
jgi:Flp pilus assembly protein TadB